MGLERTGSFRAERTWGLRSLIVEVWEAERKMVSLWVLRRRMYVLGGTLGG